jgi:hypothetical protein
VKIWEDVKSYELCGMETFTYFQQLSNGQHIGAFFQQYDEKDYNFAICIAEHPMQIDLWARGELILEKNNGNCGLEGLVYASKLLKWFIENKLPEDSKIKVHGEGQKGRAYKYLERIGFRRTTKIGADYYYVYKKKKTYKPEELCEVLRNL